MGERLRQKLGGELKATKRDSRWCGRDKEIETGKKTENEERDSQENCIRNTARQNTQCTRGYGN